MKKFLLILALISFAVIGMAQDRTGRIPTGLTALTPALTFSAADSIVTSDSLVIQITNPQRYMQHVTMTTTIDDVDGGSPSIVITLRGRVTANDTWHPIGTAVTWTAESGNPAVITSTEPHNYNWYKVSYVASGATQHSKILTFDLKTANALELPLNGGTITLSRNSAGTVTVTSKDNDANAALTIAAGGTGALTLGDANSTAAVASSDWAISTAGAMTGIGAITADGLITGGAGATITGTTTLTKDGDNVVVNPYKALNVIDVSINSASKFSVDSTGSVIAANLVKPAYLQFGTTPISNTDGSESLTAAQSGLWVVATKSDGATTMTIPDPGVGTVGVFYYFVQTADQDLIVTATTANSNSFVCDGIATSDAVTISTSGHKVGAGMFVYGISATKWYVGGLNPESVLTPEAAD